MEDYEAALVEWMDGEDGYRAWYEANVANANRAPGDGGDDDSGDHGPPPPPPTH